MSRKSNSLLDDLPIELMNDIRRIAKTSERTTQSVIERAIKLYLMGEGADILAIQKGREQIANGDSYDMDDVIDEIAAIVNVKTP